MPIEVSGVSLIQKSAIYVVMTERRSRVTKRLPPSRPPAKRGGEGMGCQSLDLKRYLEVSSRSFYMAIIIQGFSTQVTISRPHLFSLYMDQS